MLPSGNGFFSSQSQGNNSGYGSSASSNNSYGTSSTSQTVSNNQPFTQPGSSQTVTHSSQLPSNFFAENNRGYYTIPTEPHKSWFCCSRR